MSDDNVMRELSADEFGKVSGGREYATYGANGLEFWCECSGCRQYKEIIYSTKGDNLVSKGYIVGTFTCPYCGYTQDFELHL